MKDTLLKLDNIHFGYNPSGLQVKDVSLALTAGELTGIIGPNGAGKSTLLKIAAGIITPRLGKVILTGDDMSKIDRKQIALKLGYLPQHINIVPGYTVEQVVAMGRYSHLNGLGFVGKSDIAAIETAMADAGVTQFRDRNIECLSGGEQQRALLGSVLAQEPEILLLDEPTTGLDLHHQSAFFSLLARQAQNGKAVMVVTHDLNLAAKYCDRLILMYEGEMLTDGTPEAVITPEYITRAYHQDIIITSHPQTGKPVVLV
ncbi:MAG: ABC transporter ATP-binding protein [Sedimentisphaerales bacterium]|nr:ABC transporter ATP-binding protein [Sedimentisphaerales bacterium]